MVLMGLGPSGAAEVPAGDPVRVTLRAEGRSLDVVMEEVTRVQGDAARPIAEEREQTYVQREVYSRLPDGAQDLRATITHSEAYRNGVSVSDPLAVMLTGRELRLRVDESGQVVAVGGVREVVEAVQSSLPVDEVPPADVEGVSKAAAIQYEDRHAGVLGVPLYSDRWGFVIRQVRTPVGPPVNVVRASRLLRIEGAGAKSIVVVEQRSGTDPGRFGDAAAQAAAYMGQVGFSSGSARLHAWGRTELRVEMATGLVLESERRLEGVLDPPGRIGGRVSFHVEQKMKVRPVQGS